MNKNPLLKLTPAMIDVLDDMADEWADKDRHGQLAYGAAKADAFDALRSMISEAWKSRVDYRDVEAGE